MKLQTALPRVIVNSNTRGKYSYIKSIQAPRPGADDNLSKPSRIGDQLHFRNGRVTDLSGKPIKPNQATS